jgi:hypothetical protein
METEMTKTQQQAVRAFNRVFTPIMRDMSMAEACDAHFDGGEWSGPAWAEMYDDERNRVLTLVAWRFGLTAPDLNNAIYEADAESIDRYLEKQGVVQASVLYTDDIPF